MAGADELLREAQYALLNVSPGSTDEHKYTVRAKSCALQVVQKYPHSIEVAQAREILAQLNIQIAKPASPTLTGRPLAAPAVHPKMNRFAARAATTEDQWRAIFRRFIALPSGKKKLFFVVLLFFVALLPFSLFVVAGVIVLYAFNLPLLKKHLLVLLDRLEPGK